MLTGQLTFLQKTNARFIQAMDDFYLSYCINDARDTTFDYLRNYTKQYSVPAGIHADRMEIFVNDANRLPGLEPPMNDDQIKKLIFGSPPVKWQHAYIQSGRMIQMESLMKVVQYMDDKKLFSDNNSNKGKRSDNANQGNSNRTGRGMRATMRGGQRSGRGRGRSGYRSNPCRTHNGAHDWYDC